MKMNELWKLCQIMAQTQQYGECSPQFGKTGQLQRKKGCNYMNKMLMIISPDTLLPLPVLPYGQHLAKQQLPNWVHSEAVHRQP